MSGEEMRVEECVMVETRERRKQINRQSEYRLEKKSESIKIKNEE